jgi:hypothetical protein
MARIGLTQRQDFSGVEQYRWQKAYVGDEFATTEMSECVSLVYIDGDTVLGFHAGGSLEWATWRDIVALNRDQPGTRIVVVMGRLRGFFSGSPSVFEEITNVIGTYGFQYIEWQIYKSGNAIISRTGEVSSATDDTPLERLHTFISKFGARLKKP